MQDPVINGNIRNFFFSNEEELLFEINSSKLKNFGKECFQSYIERAASFEQIIKTSAQHQAFNLPPKINEFFISLETSKYFWISSNPMVYELENYSSATESKSIKNNLIKDEIRKFYIKWATEKSERERIFFAGTTKNMIEKSDSQEDIIKHLLVATIHLHERKFQSEERFLFLIDYVNNLVLNSSLDDIIKMKFIYYENIYKAFYFIVNKNYEAARINLENSLEVFPDGIVAQFYLAIVLKRCGLQDNSLTYVKNIISFDLERLSYAIEINRLDLFQYFLSDAVSYQLFKENESADMFLNIKTVLESFNIHGQTKLKSLNMLLSKLKALNVSEYFDDNIKSAMSFLEIFIESYLREKNVFIVMIESVLFQKFSKIIDSVKNRYKSAYNEKNFTELNAFEKKIQNYQNEISIIQGDIDKQKDRIKTAQKESIDKSERNFNLMISDIENAIAQIDTSQDFNPFIAFNNSLVYNFIISLIVFIVGGFVEGISDNQLSETKASGLILSVLLSGIKWSAIIFAIGLVISIITMISKIIERSNEKQRLLKKIAQLKILKEREVESIKKETDIKIKEYDNTVKLRIEKDKAHIENLNKEKQKRETELKEEAEKIFQEFENKLTTIFA